MNIPSLLLNSFHFSLPTDATGFSAANAAPPVIATDRKAIAPTTDNIVFTFISITPLFLRKTVALAVGVMQKCIRFVTVREDFLLPIPFETAPKLVRDVRKVRKAGRTVTFL